ncbi:FkbM family methyltransferase [Pseudoalteromonas sp. RB2-MNA-CIBAN-0110]|uniref:FkbM family methyltransferase n=1 Tax=Pseudoalteromonas sp. RB2-MNA-CIBAN-0110 TaxID=3140439 RepID=UPI0033327FCF
MDLSDYYLYGFNNYCRALLPRQLLKAPPLAIIDQNSDVDNFMGISILKPDNPDIDKSKPVFNCLLGYPNLEEILKGSGFQWVINTYDVFDILNNSLLDMSVDGLNYRKKPRESQINIDKIKILSGMLTDNESKSIVRRLVEFRQSPSQSTYIFPECYDMYFPPNIPNLYKEKKLRVMDVGAFNGDTLEVFARNYRDSLESYACIEVNDKNIKDLKLNIEGLGLTKITKIYNGAVGLPEDVVLVLRGKSSDTQVIAVDEASILLNDKVVNRLDFSKLLFEQQPNVIKMDIEGADYKALSEARSFIASYLPTLSLSVYHNPDDLWEIPMLINSFVGDGYNYYIRHEGHWGFETIFYAVPKK